MLWVWGKINLTKRSQFRGFGIGFRDLKCGNMATEPDAGGGFRLEPAGLWLLLQ